MIVEKVSYYYWCLHCERVFLSKVKPEIYKNEDGCFIGVSDSDDLVCCPRKDCDGSPLDAWSYDVARLNHEELARRWPPIPKVGQHYSLYDVC